jgi:hypothetical protein
MEAYKERDAVGRERWIERETPDAPQLQGGAKTTNDFELDEMEVGR